MERKPVPRLRTFRYIGPHRYFLTFCTPARQTIFRDDPFTIQVIAQLRTCAERFQFAVIAYCFMPDHAHMLVEGTSDAADLQEFVRIWKQETAFCAKRRSQITLWQRGYYEHIIRDDVTSEEVARYVLENPVRAGLVGNPDDYPYLGSFVTTVRDLMLRAQDGPGWSRPR